MVPPTVGLRPGFRKGSRPFSFARNLTILSRASILSNMNRLSTAERAKVISVLVEGNSLRATARITGVARMTIEKLLRDLGAACAAFHNERVRNIRTQRIQCDEIWSFVGAKEKHVTPDQKAQ